MRALILAAGRGERLRPLTDKIPKPLIEVNGRPLLDYVFDRLAMARITEVIINVHYKAQMIQERYANRAIFSYEKELLGTTGAIKKLCSWLGDEFVVVNGDTISNADIRTMKGIHHSKNNIVTVFTKDNATHNGGTFIFDKNIYQYIPINRPFSIHEDLLPKVLKGNVASRVGLYSPEGSFYYDCGTLEKLENVRRIYEEKADNLS